MTDRAVDLFERFLAERDAGGNPDPADFIAEAGADGEALAGMIAAYLATRPGTATADDVVAFATRLELAAPRPWSELLPERRATLGLKRSQLVERLATALGVTGAEPQVAGYLHELEAGLRSPLDVRPAVVSALAEILKLPQTLLAASRSLGRASLRSEGPAFARQALASSQELGLIPPEPVPDARVDDLFTGGPDG